MTLATAAQVRFKLADPLVIRDATYYGDGTASAFLMPHRNLQSGSAFVPITTPFTGWSATGATFNPSGMVSFAGAISAGSAFRITYQESVFSDDQIDTFVTAGGNVNGATRLGLQELIVDAAKRARWYSPDGAGYDDTLSIGALYHAYSAVLEEEQLLGAANVSIESWSRNQGWY
jgi:hypothetical protein